VVVVAVTAALLAGLLAVRLRLVAVEMEEAFQAPTA
jgi:hypothetical protein